MVLSRAGSHATRENLEPARLPDGYRLSTARRNVGDASATRRPGGDPVDMAGGGLKPEVGGKRLQLPVGPAHVGVDPLAVGTPEAMNPLGHLFEGRRLPA